MYKSIVICLCLLLSAIACADIYRTVTPDGSVSFSDQASNDQSKAIKLAPVSISKSKQTLKINPALLSNQNNDASKLDKQLIRIGSPKSGETIWNQNKIDVRSYVDPALLPGQSIRLLVDGKRVTENQSGSFVLVYLNRGEQYLQVQLIDESGEVVTRSKTIKIYVHRTVVRDKLVIKPRGGG